MSTDEDENTKITQGFSYCCFFMAIISIILLLWFAIKFLRQNDCRNYAIKLICNVCFADLIWEIMILIQISCQTYIKSNKWLYATFITLVSCSLSASYMFSALISLVAYRSIFQIFQKKFVLEKCVKELRTIGLLISQSIGLSAAIIFMLTQTQEMSNASKQTMLQVYFSIAAAYTIGLMGLCLFCYVNIYRIYFPMAHSEKFKKQINRMFIFPMIMMVTLVYPVIIDIINLFVNNNHVNLIFRSTNDVLLSSLGLLDALAYGWQVSFGDNENYNTKTNSKKLLRFKSKETLGSIYIDDTQSFDIDQEEFDTVA